MEKEDTIRQYFLNQERSLFEVYNIADHWGNQTDWRPQFTNNNRFKISPYQTVFFNTFQYGKDGWSRLFYPWHDF